jgi:hypothetical protein
MFTRMKVTLASTLSGEEVDDELGAPIRLATG